jgi:hypothetical protein
VFRAGSGVTGYPAEPLAPLIHSKGFRVSHPATKRLPAREPMPAARRRRQDRTYLRGMPPPRQMTEQDHREDALLDDRLHQLFGPPATVHQGGDIDWSWDQYQEAVAQLEAEGVIRPASEVVG